MAPGFRVWRRVKATPARRARLRSPRRAVAVAFAPAPTNLSSSSFRMGKNTSRLFAHGLLRASGGGDEVDDGRFSSSPSPLRQAPNSECGRAEMVVGVAILEPRNDLRKDYKSPALVAGEPTSMQVGSLYRPVAGRIMLHVEKMTGWVSFLQRTVATACRRQRNNVSIT